MSQFTLEKIKKVHFIGIGGIGVSAIAKMMLLAGKDVSGSDQSESPITIELVQAGAKVFLTHNSNHLADDVDLVVYTIAIPDSNPELAKAKELGLDVMSYPEVIGAISEQKKTIAIAGTHGKTTTTAMLAEIVLKAGLDPTVVVGSILKNQQSNFIAGRGDLFIVEACEYRRSFLNLTPEILIITNIDVDHLDYYQDLADIQKAFSSLVAKVPANGFIICQPNNEAIKPVLTTARGQIIDYSQSVITDAVLKTPGEHNIANAQAATAAASVLDIKKEEIQNALSNFGGTWRRFEFKGQTKKGALVYDDYAHHPTEIKATLQTARQLAGSKKIIVVFQPHLYSRTKLLLTNFADSFTDADLVMVAPIYAARETKDESISSTKLAEAIVDKGINALAIDDFSTIEEGLRVRSNEGDLIVIMGAGDIGQMANGLV